MAGTTINPYRFGGQVGYRRDVPARQYVRARHLDTTQGRWDSLDPAGFGGGDPNLYRYVINRPSSIVDASGLRCDVRGLANCTAGAIRGYRECLAEIVPQATARCQSLCERFRSFGPCYVHCLSGCVAAILASGELWICRPRLTADEIDCVRTFCPSPLSLPFKPRG